MRRDLSEGRRGHVVREDRAFQTRALVRAEAPRRVLTIRVQGTEWKPRGAGAGNEVGKQEEGRRIRRLAFSLKAMGVLSSG